jgi:hypothetical protein
MPGTGYPTCTSAIPAEPLLRLAVLLESYQGQKTLAVPYGAPCVMEPDNWNLTIGTRPLDHGVTMDSSVHPSEAPKTC